VSYRCAHEASFVADVTVDEVIDAALGLLGDARAHGLAA
jgi:hypothetical protein